MPGQLDDKTKGIIMEAVKAAQAELKEYPNIPENSETMLKYPNMNPKGIYSEIDMDIARRLKKCDTFAKGRNILERALYADVRKAVFESDRGKKLKAELAKVSKDHRTLTRAARLCKDENAKAVLLARAEVLKNSDAVKNYNLLLDGMECYAGLKGNAPFHEETIRAYDHLIGYTLPGATGYNVYFYKERPERITIDLRNTDDLANEFKLSDPGFKEPDNNWFDKVADTYAKDACKDILESRVGKLSDRLDMIIIEGNTLREIIEKKEKGNFKNLTVEQLENLACSYVTAAVKNEDRVEAFVPKESTGKVFYDDPVPITGGAPKERVTLNLWERWMSKLGFYKEKVKLVEKQNAKDQAMEECRKRAKEKIGKGKFLNEKDDSGKKRRALGAKIAAKNLDAYVEDVRTHEKTAGEKMLLRDAFFGTMRESFKSQADKTMIDLDRDQPTIYAIHMMMERGYSFEQAIDFRNYPLEDVRKEVGQQLKEDFKNMTKDKFDQMRLKCIQNLSKEVKPFAEKMAKLIKDEKSLKENFTQLALGATYMCVTAMDYFYDQKKIEKQVGAENLKTMLDTLKEADSAYNITNTSIDRYNEYHTALSGNNIKLVNVIYQRMFERNILNGLKKGKLGAKLDDVSWGFVRAVMPESPEYKKIDRALDDGNAKVIEDVFFKGGGNSMKIQIGAYGKELSNTKTLGSMSPGTLISTFDVIINGDPLLGLEEPELENDRVM